uniref:Tubby-like F-box protein n=1 Tax=Rhizophora mucronata TaxID=61149 RepID=A0A2P2IJX9_RHIMU
MSHEISLDGDQAASAQNSALISSQTHLSRHELYYGMTFSLIQ